VCKKNFVVPHTQIDSLPELFSPHFALIGYLMWLKNSSGGINRQISLVRTGVTLNNKPVDGDTLEVDCDCKIA
jgi:hypothetical protein